MSDEEDDSKKKGKGERLQELGCQCRILSFLTLITFGICSVILTAVCACTLDGDDPRKYDLAKLTAEKPEDPEERDNVNLLLTLTILSCLGTLMSVLMLYATFSKNMWLTIPYWLMLIAYLVHYFFQLMYFGFCLGKCQSIDKFDVEAPFANKPTPFANNILKNGGGNYIFSSMTIIAFLIYAFILTFGFFLQCRKKRKGSKATPKPTPPPPPPSSPPPPPPPASAPPPAAPAT